MSAPHLYLVEERHTALLTDLTLSSWSLTSSTLLVTTVILFLYFFHSLVLLGKSFIPSFSPNLYHLLPLLFLADNLLNLTKETEIIEENFHRLPRLSFPTCLWVHLSTCTLDLNPHPSSSYLLFILHDLHPSAGFSQQHIIGAPFLKWNFYKSLFPLQLPLFLSAYLYSKTSPKSGPYMLPVLFCSLLSPF